MARLSRSGARTRLLRGIQRGALRRTLLPGTSDHAGAIRPLEHATGGHCGAALAHGPAALWLSLPRLQRPCPAGVRALAGRSPARLANARRNAHRRRPPLPHDARLRGELRDRTRTLGERHSSSRGSARSRRPGQTKRTLVCVTSLSWGPLHLRRLCT